MKCLQFLSVLALLSNARASSVIDVRPRDIYRRNVYPNLLNDAALFDKRNSQAEICYNTGKKVLTEDVNLSGIPRSYFYRSRMAKKN